MKVTYNWLKDFVEIKIPPELVAEKLTMAGLEVTALTAKDKDYVFEVEVTANRADCLSVVGIARELAAVTGKKLAIATKSEGHQVTSCKARPFSIQIEDKKDCPLYIARIIKDVKVGLSPEWLRKRLELIGCRSINNIVDTTNYVLFTWGEPLHAFDLDRLSSDTVIVRRAKKEEKIVIIDGQEKTLDPDTLVIADKEKPLAIAGIMGGQDTEVTGATKNILLEAAVFNPVILRRSRRALGLESEAAYRFERGIDLGVVENASWQAAKYLQELASGECILVKSAGAPKIKPKSISLGISNVRKILGFNIAPARIKKILCSRAIP